MNLQNLATCLLLLALCSQAIPFDEAKLNTGKGQLQSKKFKVFTKYFGYALGGVWPVYPYVFYKKPYPQSFTEITFSLLDNKAIADQNNKCLGLFTNQMVAPYPCSSKNVIRWEMKGEWIYAIDYKKCLYGTDWVQSSAFGMAALEPCVERSKLAIKYV